MKLNCLIVLCEIICCCSEVSDKKWDLTSEWSLVVVVAVTVVVAVDEVAAAAKDVICSETFVSNVQQMRDGVCVRVSIRTCVWESECVRTCGCACEHLQKFVREKERLRERACVCECALKKWDGEREEVISELEVDGSSEIRLWRLSRVSSN